MLFDGGHQQHVRAGHIGERPVDAQMHEVVVVVDHTRILGAQHHLRTGQVREDLVGSDGIKRGESLVKTESDDHRAHYRRLDLSVKENLTDGDRQVNLDA